VDPVPDHDRGAPEVQLERIEQRRVGLREVRGIPRPQVGSEVVDRLVLDDGVDFGDRRIDSPADANSHRPDRPNVSQE